MKEKFAIIECCNFIDFPTGGQLTFAKNLIQCCGPELVLIGLANDKKNVGTWSKININGVHYEYFPYLYLPKSKNKPFIPLRIRNYLALRKYKKEITKLEFENIIIQSPEVLFAIRNFNFKNICYRFAGIENPLTISRYKFANLFSNIFDKYFFPNLTKVNLLLATADDNAINELILRSKGHIKKQHIFRFPTSVDTNIFKKLDKINSREILAISENDTVIVTTGRLGWFKGWKFMIDAFKIFKNSYPKAKFFFIGNGEDYNKIANYVKELQLLDSVFLIGFQNQMTISNYLNAADLFIMGSFKEGWSTSLIEALVCGTPSCTTNFSSAKDILKDGITGYVLENRNMNEFASLMIKGLAINRSCLPRTIDISKYSSINLMTNLLNIWHLQ